jgi:hypothetical protein
VSGTTDLDEFLDDDNLLDDDDFEIPIRYIEEDDWEPHPPQAFRDKSNGE